MKKIALLTLIVVLVAFPMTIHAGKVKDVKVVNTTQNAVPVQGSVEVTNPASTPLDVNVVNNTPIAVDANVAFPATLDVNIVNTEPISTVQAGDIINAEGWLVGGPPGGGGNGYPESWGYGHPVNGTLQNFVITDIICSEEILIFADGDGSPRSGTYLATLPAGHYSFTTGFKFEHSMQVESNVTAHIHVVIMGRTIPGQYW